MDAVINPFSGAVLPDAQADFVRELRTVRRGARNAMRSGHPGKRAEAARINAIAPGMIRKVYAQNV